MKLILKSFVLVVILCSTAFADLQVSNLTVGDPTFIRSGSDASARSGIERAIVDSVAFASDSDTGERGVMVKYINRTGGASVKGSLVSASTSVGNF